MSRGGVYVYRARKPSARLRIPLVSWHFAYVGETTSFFHRHAQHLEQRPWSDRSPYVAFRIPLPRWKWLLRTVETLVILLVWPVYNHAKNQWNPRRISLSQQRWQRECRDSMRWCVNWTVGHAFLVVVALTLAIRLVMEVLS